MNPISIDSLAFHLGADIVYFGLAIIISYFIARRMLRSSTNISTIFAVSLFAVVFLIVQRLLLLVVGLAFGPLGLLMTMIANSYLYIHPLEIVLYPLLSIICGGWLIARWASKKNAEANMAAVMAPPVEDASRWRGIKTFLMAGAAILLFGWLMYSPVKDMLIKASLPSLVKNPALCKESPLSNQEQYDCVMSSIPEDKTVHDYCDYLPFGMNGEAPLTSNMCHLERVLALRDVNQCAQLDIRTQSYSKCVAQYPESDVHAAVCKDLEADRNLIRLLVTRCITKDTANLRDAQGKTPLFFADTIEEQNTLFEFGADANARQTSGQSVLLSILHWQNGNSKANDLLPLIENLLKHGADPNSVGEGRETPLSYTTSNYSTVETVKLLISYGAKIDEHCKQFKTFGTQDKTDRSRYIYSLCQQ